MTRTKKRLVCLILLIGLIIISAMGEIIKLPPPPGADMPLHRTIEERRSRRSYGSGGINLEQVSELLWASAGITSSRGFRAAPSAGATYPIDIYLLAENVEGLEPAIYRYIEESHALEPIKEGLFIEDLANAALRQSALKDASAVICLFGIYERTTRRYGERGKRYVHIEIGHIGQNIYLVAEALGLSTVAIGAFHDDRVSALFGVEGVPLYLMPVGPRRE